MLGFILSVLFYIYCLVSGIQLLRVSFVQLEKNIESQEMLHKKQTEFLRCASFEALKLNLEEAFLYLTKVFPQKKKELTKAWIASKSPFEIQASCVFKTKEYLLRGDARQEENHGLPLHWPNWVPTVFWER